MKLPSRMAWLAGALAVGAWAGCSSSANTSAPTKTPPVQAPDIKESPLDQAFENAWKTASLAPSAPIDDATFLRRVSLDLVGRVPTSTELRSFLADTTTDKKPKAVDRLLASPEHAKYLARLWDQILMGPYTKGTNVDRAAFERWLELEFTAKTPWDQVVRGIVAAKGKNSLGGKRGPESFEGGLERAKEERDQGVNGATNFVLRHAQTPGDLAGDVSRDFLGVQIQCAQCHDHKTEAWKQTDFRSFAAALLSVKPERLDKEKGSIPIFDLEDSKNGPPKRLLRNADTKALAEAPPRALDGTDLPRDKSREALAAWMTSADNKWFARAIVNRVWSQMFGSGFVDPPDDFREKNPAVVPEALDRLAADFLASHDDLDALYREITSSIAYARSTAPGSSRDALFSHGELEGMSTDQLFDSVFTATSLDDTLAKAKKVNPDVLKIRLRRRMGFVFDDDSEANSGGYEGTIQQALFLMNVEPHQRCEERRRDRRGALPPHRWTHANRRRAGFRARVHRRASHLRRSRSTERPRGWRQGEE
jgi:Protein of unknown function (DUF1549)/Protein of unknown function (DUF1553)